MPSRAYKQFLKLDESKYGAGEYIIMVDEQVVRHGPGSELKKMFEEVKREYPNKMPFVAKIPAEGVLIFFVERDNV